MHVFSFSGRHTVVSINKVGENYKHEREHKKLWHGRVIIKLIQLSPREEYISCSYFSFAINSVALLNTKLELNCPGGITTTFSFVFGAVDILITSLCPKSKRNCRKRRKDQSADLDRSLSSLNCRSMD